MKSSPRRPGSPSRGLAILAAVFLVLCACGRSERPGPFENVVLVSVDDLAARNVGAYGYERETTPNLDQLAAEGTLFEAAYVQQTWTLTSHFSMLSGVYPGVHGASLERPARPNVPTLAEMLKAHGFATAGFVGLGGYMAPEFGMARGFDRYEIGVGDAPQDNRSRLDWLDEQARLRSENPDHRFFLFAHYYDVHSDAGTPAPYFAPPPYGFMFLPGGLRKELQGDTAVLGRLQMSGKATEEDRRVIQALYDGGVRYCDQEGLGPLIQRLRDLGLYDKTLIIVTADHGEEFLEHGAATHQQPYRETSRVPLVFRGPGIPAGLRVPDLVESVDLVPTVLSLLSIPIPEIVQGADLTPLFEKKPIEKNVAFVDGILRDWRTGKSQIVADLDGDRWAYVNTIAPRTEGEGTVFEATGADELYRLDTDPGQANNLAPDHPELAGELRQRLLGWFSANEGIARDLGVWVPKSRILSEEEEEKLRALGYVH